MKHLLKLKIAMLVLLIGMAFSCKKTETNTLESTTYDTDSTQTAIDTVGPEVDTTAADTSGTIKTDSIRK